jgi:hypothetical protein
VGPLPERLSFKSGRFRPAVRCSSERNLKNWLEAGSCFSTYVSFGLFLVEFCSWAVSPLSGNGDVRVFRCVPVSQCTECLVVFCVTMRRVFRYVPVSQCGSACFQRNRTSNVKLRVEISSRSPALYRSRYWNRNWWISQHFMYSESWLPRS